MSNNPTLLASSTGPKTPAEMLFKKFAQPEARLLDLINEIGKQVSQLSEDLTISAYSDHQNGISVLRLGKKPSKDGGAKQVFTIPVEWHTWAEEKGIGNKVLSARFIVRGGISNETESFLNSLVKTAEVLNTSVVRKPPVAFWGARNSTMVKWGIVASGDKSLELLSLIELYAAAKHTVLITGETGCGKELVASALHQASKLKGRFFAINCAAISKELIESELFGHRKGAFTGATVDRDGYFQAAKDGTLFLDEIGELSLDLQAKLLRVLQEGKVRRVGSNVEEDIKIRVVAATNRDLSEMVGKGEFRADLYYRLNCLTLNIAPLRERAEEIPNLVDFLLKKISEESGREISISEMAMNRILLHDFPGNVRELVNVLEAGSVFAQGGLIEIQHLKINGEFEEIPNTTRRAATTAAASGPKEASEATELKGGDSFEEDLITMFWGKTYQEIEETMKRVMFKHALQQTGGHINRAAESLGLERTKFSRHAKDLGLLKKDEEPTEMIGRLNLNLNLSNNFGSPGLAA